MRAAILLPEPGNIDLAYGHHGFVRSAGRLLITGGKKVDSAHGTICRDDMAPPHKVKETVTGSGLAASICVSSTLSGRRGT